MAKSKSRANSEPKMEAPETLDDHPFYGIKLDPEQKILVDTIWSKDYDIIFVNARSGVGKTTTSANIGTALAKAGNKVVLIIVGVALVIYNFILNKNSAAYIKLVVELKTPN